MQRMCLATEQICKMRNAHAGAPFLLGAAMMCVGIAVAATIDLKAGQGRHRSEGDGDVGLAATDHGHQDEHSPRCGSHQRSSDPAAERELDLEASRSQDVTDSLLIRSRSGQRPQR